MARQISGRNRAVLICTLLVLTLVACARRLEKGMNETDGRGIEEVIYGEDNRNDLYAEPDARFREIADSTVALMSDVQLAPEVNGHRAIQSFSYTDEYRLCSDERFAQQKIGAFCSGFLIAPQLVATAGHCVRDLETCLRTSFAFGFALNSPGAQPQSLPASEIYSCRSVVKSQSTWDGTDYAVIELDRAVLNHKPLRLSSKSDSIAVGTDVAVVGYPSGLPLKIAGGAKVRDVASADHFITNLDTYGGNSGSAVVNSSTYEVEGILVRGDRDFVFNEQDGCARSYRCKADECRGEDVTRISEITKALSSARPD